jgi:hypothetical protein
MTLKLEWLDGESLPYRQPDPLYPNGVDIEERAGASPTCFTTLPYPAPRCGVWVISCPDCKKTVVITAAGRADDARSARVTCLRTYAAPTLSQGGAQ